MTDGQFISDFKEMHSDVTAVNLSVLIRTILIIPSNSKRWLKSKENRDILKRKVPSKGSISAKAQSERVSSQ